ncbi:winged helix-turn-helix domain-containing protein [Streptomyces sp. NPDC005181]|uniref:helix-turn-helix domain-containing protein n=1 Tax=Streptomyces sp. NPDC005181 TaxID=3156869 RepID=UPI0033B22869
MIRRDFGVALSAVSVGWLPRELGLSPQRPLWRAWQQDPAAVERWKCEEFPAIKAEAERQREPEVQPQTAGIHLDRISVPLARRRCTHPRQPLPGMINPKIIPPAQ